MYSLAGYCGLYFETFDDMLVNSHVRMEILCVTSHNWFKGEEDRKKIQSDMLLSCNMFNAIIHHGLDSVRNAIMQF